MNTPEAIEFSKNNLDEAPSMELYDLIIETAKYFPPIKLWEDAFRNHQYIIRGLKNAH